MDDSIQISWLLIFMGRINFCCRYLVWQYIDNVADEIFKEE